MALIAVLQACLAGGDLLATGDEKMVEISTVKQLPQSYTSNADNAARRVVTLEQPEK
jgi:hypothetical protein